MLALFYIFIGVAIGVSVWQITRIMDFRGSIADDNDNAAQGKYAIGFLAFLYAMMIYCSNLHECYNVARICFY